MSNRTVVILAGVIALSVGAALAQDRTHDVRENGMFARWDNTTLTVGNDCFTRVYRAADGELRTVSLKTADGTELVRPPRLPAEGKVDVVCRKRPRSPAGVAGLEVVATVKGRTTTLWVFPGVPGVLTEWRAPRSIPAIEVDASKDGYRRMSDYAFKLLPAAEGAGDRIDFSFFDGQAVEYTLADQTDRHDDLLTKRTRIFRSAQLNEEIRVPSLDVRDSASGRGVVYLRLASLPAERPSNAPDFVISASVGALIPIEGAPLAELAYEGGEFGRLKALQSFQRAIRPYRAGRDGVFLSNTWGDGNGDSRINEAFILREIAAAADLGVEVVQVDDGWQRGRTSNSSRPLLPGLKKTWGDYWDTDPLFWKPDAERLPNGLQPLVAAAKEKGVSLGLWFGPDSTDDLKYWERDADCLLDLYRTLGIRYFKIDSLHITSATGLGRNRAFFDKMLDKSGSEMVFDLDCTAGVRPGYFGMPDIGPLFLENRYAKTQTRRYRPHLTLRNLWSLAHVVDPVRLRIEVLNPSKGRETYRDDPLAPEKWPVDALFAIAMVASPLGWMEVSEVPDSVCARWKPLIARWKAERDALHAGTIVPVGECPDGYSWTGFASVGADGAQGQVILFREASARTVQTLDLNGLFSGAREISSVERLGGRGNATVRDGVLTAEIPEKFDFIWLKLGSRKN